MPITRTPTKIPRRSRTSLRCFSIVVVPAALTYTYGRMVGRPRQGRLLLWVMVFLCTVGLVCDNLAEQHGNIAVAPAVHAATAATSSQPGGNMEGKEVRFGIKDSVLTTIVTANSMLDSYTPLGGLVPLVNMALGEIVFGGLGSGLYSIVAVVLFGLFLAGLMIGRTPEYLGKRIEPAHMKVIMLFTLGPPVTLLGLAALAVITSAGRAGLTTNTGPHGLTEILYAYATTMANNGEAFAGLSANSLFYNLTTVVSMIVGRYFLGVMALALAGIFVRQRRRPLSAGTLPTDSPTFTVVIVGTAMLVVALTFLPVFALGPIVEHFRM